MAFCFSKFCPKKLVSIAKLREGLHSLREGARRLGKAVEYGPACPKSVNIIVLTFRSIELRHD